MRINQWGGLLALLGLPLLAAFQSKAARADDAIQELHGWKVEVGPELRAAEHDTLRELSLAMLANELFELSTVLPEERVEELRAFPIRIDLADPLGGLQYHPSRQWLVDHGHSPKLANHVHIPTAQAFVELVRSGTQPFVLLHELSHAWHDQVLGFEEPRLAAAWERVTQAGLYDEVLDIRGNRRQHYGLTDPKEFFAEMSEAYWGTNDFYPFVRGELQEVDPETATLIEQLWEKGE